MKVGIATSHLYSMGGGYQAVKWHILALKSLGHAVTVFTRNAPSDSILRNWFDNVPLRQYNPHCEKNFDVFINIDHFAQALPEAGLNLAHTFFPMEKTPPPAEGVKIYSNSAYTARHIRLQWNREATPLYIPIDDHFHSGNKERVILHVSRFSEPSEYADKGHRQMIQAFKLISKKMPGWKMVLAGSVDPRQEMYVNELMRLAQGWEIDFAPNMGNQALSDLFAKSSIYWHATGVSLPTIASAQEHMGITPIEAQASGCVPLVFNSGGMPEVVLDHHTGLLYDNVMDLPHMTLELANNLTAWAQLSQAGQVWARSWSDFQAFVQRVDDMLNDRLITPLKPFMMELKHSPVEVTAVIPTFNSPLLQQCLDSLTATAPEIKVLIINNGESLSSLRVDHNVTVYEAGKNLGFARAHQLASSMVTTPLVLMLNDDVIANSPGWLEQLLFMMNHEQVGVVGPKLYYPDGRLQFCGGLVNWNRDDIGYHRNYGEADSVEVSTPQEVDFITGAALLCRKELYEIPDELLDFVNFEDTWLCFSAKEKGFKVVYQPGSSLTHVEGQTKQRLPEMVLKVNGAKAEFKKRWVK